jgi:hypothetical protein
MHANSGSNDPPGSGSAPSIPLRPSTGSAGGGRRVPNAQHNSVLPGTAELPTQRVGVCGAQASRGVSSPSSSLSNSEANRSVHGG